MSHVVSGRIGDSCEFHLDPAEFSERGGQNKPVIEKRIGLVQLQREADALARTAQTILSDLANVSERNAAKGRHRETKTNRKALEALRSELNP